MARTPDHINVTVTPDDGRELIAVARKISELRLQLARARAAFIDADSLRRINRVEGNFTADQLDRWKARASDRFDKIIAHGSTEPRS